MWDWELVLGMEQFGVQHSSASEARGRQQCLRSAETVQGFRGSGVHVRELWGRWSRHRSVHGMERRTTRPHLLNLFPWRLICKERKVEARMCEYFQRNSAWSEGNGIWSWILDAMRTFYPGWETLVFRNFNTTIMRNIWTLDDSRLSCSLVGF